MADTYYMENTGRGRKVLILCGSGPEGSTAEMCRASADSLSEAGFTPIVVMPIGMGISHCTGCQNCSADAECVIEDRMSELYALFRECDGVVMATPLRFSGPSSVIKAVMDRMQIYWDHPEVPRPRWILMSACSGSDSPDFSHLRSIMRAFSITLGMEWIGEIYVTGTDGGRDHVYGQVRSSFDDIITSGKV